MERLTIPTYYNDKPATVKVLYELITGDIFEERMIDFEIIAARYMDGNIIDIEELMENEEFLDELEEDILEQAVYENEEEEDD